MPAGGNWKDLLEAAGEGNVEQARYQLSAGGVDPDFQHPEYFTAPIFEAIRANHLDILKLLVDEGKANPNLKEEQSGSTPIQVALEEKRHDIVDYLNTKLPSDSQHKPRNVLVTGGNRGIGRAICQLLLEKGARVVFTCRSASVGEQVAGELQAVTQNRKVDYVVGDLSSIRSTQQLADSIQKQSCSSSLDTLILNAGMWPTVLEMNEDGVELSFMVNYLANYLLMERLYPLLHKNATASSTGITSSRIVFVSAGLALWATTDITKTPFGRDFHRFQTYAKTKQCALFLFLNWIHKLQTTTAAASDNKVVVMSAVHPGVINTDLGTPRNGCLACIMKGIKQLWGKPSDGAVAPVWLALLDDEDDNMGEAVHGKFYNQKEECALPELFQNQQTLKDWEQWTVDFLARRANEK